MRATPRVTSERRVAGSEESGADLVLNLETSTSGAGSGSCDLSLITLLLHLPSPLSLVTGFQLRYESTVETTREDRLNFAKHFERAQGWLLLDKFTEAITALDELPTVFHSHPAVILLRAHVHMEAKQWALAEPLLRLLLKNDDTEPQYWINLAFVVRRAKSLKEAEPILQEARQRFPKMALIWFNLACYAAQQARVPEAHELLREALRLEPALKEQAATDPDLVPLRNSGLKSQK